MLAAVLLALVPQVFGSTSESLGALTAPRAELRSAAERYLAGHLQPSDREAIIDYVAKVDVESEGGVDALWRLGQALGASGRNLPLALEFFAGGAAREENPGLDLEPLVSGEPAAENPIDTRLRGIGDHALDELISGWRSGLDRVPVSGAALQLLLRDEREREPWTPLVVQDGPIADVVDRLARLGNLPMPLVIAPSLAERLAQERFGGSEVLRDEPFRGPWDKVLLAFAKSHGVTWEAVLADGEFGDEIAWLCLLPRGEETDETGFEQLRSALEDFSRHRQGPRNQTVEHEVGRASKLQLTARLLANIEWPAALAWLGNRWLVAEKKDGMALAGLLEAAGRGHFEPRLLRPGGLRRLLRYGDQIAASEAAGGPQQSRLRHALAALPHLGSAGPLDPLVLAGWGTEDERFALEGPLLMRLVALEAVGGGGVEGARRAQEILQDATGIHARGDIQLAALRVLAVAADEVEGNSELFGESIELQDPAPLLELAGLRVAPDELARLLVRGGVTPPVAHVREVGLARVGPAALRVVFSAALLSGDVEVAGALLEDVLGVNEPGSWLRILEGLGPARGFRELEASLEASVRRGELFLARSAIGSAREQASRRRLGERDGATDLGAATDEEQFREPTALDRLELLAGAMSPARQALLMEHLIQEAESSPLYYDLEALALLAAGPNGELARELLLGRFDAALQSPKVGQGGDILGALEVGIAFLWARSADEEVRDLIFDVAEVAAGVSSHPLAKQVLYQAWPPAPARIVRNLDLLDR